MKTIQQKKLLSAFLALILLLSAFSVPAFAETENLSSLDVYEGLTTPTDSLYDYLQRLRCKASEMPPDSFGVAIYENGEEKLETNSVFQANDGDEVASLTVKSIMLNNLDANPDTGYRYAFVDRDVDHTLVFKFSASYFTDDAVFTFNGSSDNVSVSREGVFFVVTVGPTKIATKVCGCSCHIIWWKAKNPVDFFKALWGAIQLKFWELTKNKDHQYCECGNMHYAV